MALELSLREICSNLQSIRATERKKSAETLKDMLSRTAVPSLLNENTLKKSGYTWNHVFGDINDYILKETEKFETNKNFSVVVGIATSLLNLCVSGSNKGGAHIKCDVLMDACSNIFNDTRLRKAIGDAYFNVLYKHILNNDYFIGYITPEMWENLLDISVTTCLTKFSELDNLTKFKFLLLVVQNASNSSQFLVCLRDALPDIKTCFRNVIHDKIVQEFVLKTVLLLMELLASECRLYICEFSETLLPLLFKIYDHSMDAKKKSLLFKVLQIAFVIHHPMGRLQKEQGSMAHNWEIWNKHVHSILEIICLEINNVQKNLKHNSSQTHVDNFSYLTAITYYQIFNEDCTDVVEEIAENSAKKQKLSFDNKKSFFDLLEELHQNSETWISIIHMYVKHFGNTLTPSHFMKLLNISEILVSKTGKAFNWSDFGNMTCQVLHYFIMNAKLIVDGSSHNDFISLWNTCVRNSAVQNAAHESIHMIILSLLKLDIIKYTHVQPLLTIYFEKRMPVDNHTLKTFSSIYYRFFSNCCQIEQRLKCFTWLTNVDINDVDVIYLEEIFVQIISDDNLPLAPDTVLDTCSHSIHDILFKNIEKRILFGTFDFEIDTDEKVTVNKEETIGTAEMSREVSDWVIKYLGDKLSEFTTMIASKDNPVNVGKYIHLTLLLYKSLLKYKIFIKEDVLTSSLYVVLIESLKKIFVHLTRVLKSSDLIKNKIALLKCLQGILENDYNSFLDSVIRSCINEDTFHCINEILKTEVTNDEDEFNSDDDIELSLAGLRHHCIYFLAAYCSHDHDYTDELIKCILDEDVYKFESHCDVECAFKCINMIIRIDRDNKFIDNVLGHMQTMCRNLFRNSKASLGILQIILQILDKVWLKNDHVIRQNCIIMVRSYMQRCTKLYYPPRVAVLVYECVARIIELNKKHHIDLDDSLQDVLIEQLKGNIHNMRIYCCYLMKRSCGNNIDIKIISNTLMDIFVINVSNNNETVLKDETTNRTLTVSHCFLALSQIKPYLIHDIALELIHIQKKKGLSKHIIKKVLNIIIKKSMGIYLEEYADTNIKRILQYWFKENEGFQDIPLSLLGFKSIDAFIEKHSKWLIAMDILWRNNGYIEKSEATKYVVNKSGKSLEDIIEICFCSIISLCLPYIVTEKYKLEDQKQSDFKIRLENANRMFQSTRQILKNEKWSNLFVEHMGELIRLAALHMFDPESAELEFQVNLMTKKPQFTYTKTVFNEILRYFGELIDGNIMQYLCENQPLIILTILFKLWANFIKEKILQMKTIYLHTYTSFIENIILGNQSDAVLCNFACNSVVNAIAKSKVSEEINILVHSLEVMMEKILKYPSDRLDTLKKSVISKILAILSIKKETGFIFSNSLETYLLEFINSQRGDVVDYIDLMYKNEIGTHVCSSKEQFQIMLQKYITNLSYPSHDILLNLRQFLKTNNNFVNGLIKDLNIKGFSEDCLKSLVHCVINSLNNILITSNDDKIIIQACNCLSELCTYDIKSLVTVPADTKKAVTLAPKEYFAFIVLTTLTEVLFDEDPAVNSRTAKAINRLLKFRDGKLALDMEGINKELLEPLSPTTSEIFSVYRIDDSKFNRYNRLDFWVPKQNEDHTKWIERITTALLDVIASQHNCASAVRDVCNSKPSVCTTIMPAVLGLLLDCNSEKVFQIISEQINQFFQYIWKIIFKDENVEDFHLPAGTTISNLLDNTHKNIIQYIINVINFIRLQAEHYKTRQSRCVDRLNYLNIDYVKVSLAAALADCSMVAIYYGELGAAAANGGVPPDSPDATSRLDGGSHLQRIFRGCFVSIGEMDAVEGCGTAHLTSEGEKRKHLINTGQFADSLVLHDIALSYGAQDRALQYGTVVSLHKSGMHHLALQYIKSCPENEDLDDIKYDCLSYLGDWTAIVDTRELEAKSQLATYDINSFTKMYRYACLKDCLNIQPSEEFPAKFEQTLNAAKLTISRMCRDLNMENSQCVYNIMANLHLFRDIENYFAVRCGKEKLTKLIDDWGIEKLPPYKDFTHLEGLISQRSLILQHAAENNGIHSTIINSLHLQYAELALLNERVQMAQRIVAMVKRFHPSKEVTLIESKVSWEKGHKDIALSLLHGNVYDESDNAKLTAMSLRQYGLWMGECKRENARDIINKYLEKSLNVLKEGDDVKTRLKVYYDIATFADAEYKQVVSYMNSTTFENKVKCLESLKGTVESLKSSQLSLTRDERRALIANNAFRDLDEADIANTRAERDTFLNLAMRYYLQSLEQSDENNLSVFRVISLWFENNNIDLDCEETGRLGTLLQGIPSWKFITVLPQIAPRLSSEDTPFANHLRNLITRCAIEHPHHTLPILFNLKNSDKDVTLRGQMGLSSGSRASISAPEPRVIAAEQLINGLATRSPELGVIVEQMEVLCDAIIRFAYSVPTAKEIGKPLPIPKTEGISKLRNLNNTPVPIDTIAIRKDFDYSGILSLSSFENHYELVGGINFPKKISCRRSDGKKRILLIKGEDDLRQDAVMQQVFNIVNTLLEKNPVTYHNKLLIRTYKVVAMSRRSGVLEWCEGTMPLGSYLMQAHKQYRPQDIHPNIARSKMKECHENRRSNKHKLAVFNEILRVFKPVFHYFFTEHYLDPVTWYERRLAYTRSVATSSMVGYIMGLGDRHVQNILIDKTTAEVIHIDFGIAFDQGKTLPTPETVPFRLTQDIIAGFGCSGVEGIFRNCCEKTLQLLRDNQETLLTILEVLLCDPLYLWIVPSAAKNAGEQQGEGSGGGGGGGGLAARALLAVRGKLCGAERGAAAVSARGHVAALLRRATDRANLCRLFHGWQPYL